MEFSYTCSKNCRPSLNWSSSFTLCNLRGQKVDLKFTQQNMQSVALQSSYDHGGITLNHRTRERGNFIFHATLTQSLHLTFATSFFSTYFGFRLAQRTSPKRRNCSLSTVVITEFKKRRLRRRGQREEIYKDL